MLILKIMSADRGNDEHPRHGYQIITGIRRVWFQERNGEHRARLVVDFANEERDEWDLDGNVYVMNEAGKTISKFEVHAPADLEGPVPDDMVKAMVGRFLSWKLPEDFHPDCGIHFDAEAAIKMNPRNTKYEPVGTNLFNYDQAEAMVRHMLGAQPA